MAMKRFYQTATAAPGGNGGGRVLLDGRPVKTPAKADMLLPTLALAEAIAAEWEAQDGEIRPQTMPLMRLAATAIDQVAPAPHNAIAEIVRYGDTDLLCYRAEAPADLVRRQAEAWQPMLDWFRRRYDIQLATTAGIMAVAQPAGLADRLARICQPFDSFRLTALHSATTATGSVVLGLALLEGEIDSAAAWRISLLDETYQSELWGEDAEAAERRRNLARDLDATGQFLVLLTPARA